MKREITQVAIFAVALLGSMHGQTTTDTTCLDTLTGMSCTSTTRDRAAEQQRQYEQGRQMGQDLGNIIANSRARHWVKKFCAAHPGQSWWYQMSTGERFTGDCPVGGGASQPAEAEDKVGQARRTFLVKHPDFIQTTRNATAMYAYLDEHKLDPAKTKSYDKAYRDLKKKGQLDSR